MAPPRKPTTKEIVNVFIEMDMAYRSRLIQRLEDAHEIVTTVENRLTNMPAKALYDDSKIAPSPPFEATDES